MSDTVLAVICVIACCAVFCLTFFVHAAYIAGIGLRKHMADHQLKMADREYNRLTLELKIAEYQSAKSYCEIQIEARKAGVDIPWLENLHGDVVLDLKHRVEELKALPHV